MTYSLEIQIEELRAELRDAVYREERCGIEAELALAEREAVLVEAYGEIDTVPRSNGDLR